MKRSASRGFTLIELLIVVVIIGVLAAIAIPKFTSMRDRSFKAAMVSDLKNLATQQEIRHAETAQYSTDLGVLGMNISEGVSLSVNEASGSGWSAQATHDALTGENCGIFYGNAAAAGGAPGAIEGVIACTF